MAARWELPGAKSPCPGGVRVKGSPHNTSNQGDSASLIDGARGAQHCKWLTAGGAGAEQAGGTRDSALSLQLFSKPKSVLK